MRAIRQLDEQECCECAFQPCTCFYVFLRGEPDKNCRDFFQMDVTAMRYRGRCQHQHR